MPEPEKEKGKAPRMIPETDLITFKESAKNREKKLELALAEERSKRTESETLVKQYESQIKTLKTNLEDDEETKNVRQFLMDEDKRIAEDRSKLDTDRKANEGLLKEAKAKMLVLDYKGKGLELKEEDLLTQEDMDKHVNGLWVEHLSKENERLKAQPSTPAEGIFERGGGDVIKKAVPAMSNEEFEKHWGQQLQEATQKR